MLVWLEKRKGAILTCFAQLLWYPIDEKFPYADTFYKRHLTAAYQFYQEHGIFNLSWAENSCKQSQMPFSSSFEHTIKQNNPDKNPVQLLKDVL